MKTIHFRPTTFDQQLDELTETLRASRDAPLAVTVAAEDELLSPNQTAARLGFSRQHVVRLIQAGELAGSKLEGSSYWQMPMSSIVEFEQRRALAQKATDDFSRSLDAAGAPLE